VQSECSTIKYANNDEWVVGVETAHINWFLETVVFLNMGSDNMASAARVWEKRRPLPPEIELNEQERVHIGMR